MKMKNLNRLWHDEEGQDLLEYALLVALSGFIGFAINTLLAPAIVKAFSTAAANLASTT